MGESLQTAEGEAQLAFDLGSQGEDQDQDVNGDAREVFASGVTIDAPTRDTAPLALGALMQRLGVDDEGAAALLRVHKRQLSRWSEGQCAPPWSAIALLTLCAEFPIVRVRLGQYKGERRRIIQAAG